MDRSEFACLGRLYGRDHEIAVVKEAFTESLQDSRQFLVVGGPAGIGKSSLALQAKSLVQEMGGFYVSGKFFPQANKPYSAIADGFNDLFEDLLLQRGETNDRWTYTVDEIIEKIKSTIDDVGISMLQTIIPSLREIQVKPFILRGDINFRTMKPALHNTLRQLLGIVSYFGPIVLVLDDLQNVDEDSMEFVDFLLADDQLSRILIIATYRDAEVDEEHILREWIRMSEDDESDMPKVKEIKLKNLEDSDVRDMMSTLTSRSDEEVRRLSKLIHYKTGGNSFFVKRLLFVLQKKNLLKFDKNLSRWLWDLELIEEELKMREPISEFMTASLTELPTTLQRLLPRLAIIGPNIPKSHLEILGNHYCGSKILLEVGKHIQTRHEGSKQSIGDALDQSITSVDQVSISPSFQAILEHEELLTVSGGHLTWDHDILKEAAILTETCDTIDRMGYDIGKLLLEKLDVLNNSDILLVTKLLNMGIDGSQENDPFRIEIASLNQKAGGIALTCSAFSQAVIFFERGIAILPENKWDERCDLALELFIGAAEAYFGMGEYEKTKMVCDEALELFELDILKKRRLHNIEINSLGAQGRNVEAKNITMNVLSQLKCKFPPKRLRGIFASRRNSLNNGTEETSQLPPANDETIEWTIYLIDRLITFCYQCDHQVLLLAMKKGLRYTMQYGTAKMIGPIFAVNALMRVANVGDLAGGKRYANLAISLKNRETEARILLVSYQYVLHYQIPYEQCKISLRQAYEAGMKAGDIESSLWCSVCLLELQLFHGSSNLNKLLRDCQTYAPEMERYQQKLILLQTKLIWQAVTNLVFASPKKYIFQGDICDEKQMMSELDGIENILTVRQLHRLKTTLAFWFNDHDAVVELMEQNDYHKFALEKSMPGMLGIAPLYFQMALSCISLAQKYEHKKEISRRHKNQAKKFLDRISDWVKKGNPNTQHYESLLQAEMEALEGKDSRCRKQFDVAISLAERWRFKNDLALCHERYADYLSRVGEDSEASKHYDTAVHLYEEWGANGRVEVLRRTVRLLRVPVSHIQFDSQGNLDEYEGESEDSSLSL